MSDRAMAPFIYYGKSVLLFKCHVADLFTMLLGYGFRKIGLLDESFKKKINRFVFRAALPLLLLEDLWSADFQTLWDGKFVGFCGLS